MSTTTSSTRSDVLDDAVGPCAGRPLEPALGAFGEDDTERLDDDGTR